MKVRSSYSRKNVQADYNLSHFEILLSNRSLYYFGPLSPDIVGPFFDIQS